MKDKNVLIIIAIAVLLLMAFSYYVGRTTVDCPTQTKYVNDPKQIIKQDSLTKVIAEKDTELLALVDVIDGMQEQHDLQKPLIKKIIKTKTDTFYLFSDSSVTKYIIEADSIIDLQDSAITMCKGDLTARDSLIDFMKYNAELNNFEKQTLELALGKSEKKRIQNKTAWQILGGAAAILLGVAVIK